MKSLYRQFISAMLYILLLSVVIGFIIANIMYYTSSKEKIDQQNVKTAEEIVQVLEDFHGNEDAMAAYLSSIGQLGYQFMRIDPTGKQVTYGEQFTHNVLPEGTIDKVLNGEIYHGMQDFRDIFLMMGHFSNRLENSVGVPMSTATGDYALFMRPNNKMLFTDFHMILVGFIVAIAIISITGVALLARQLIRPISELTEATKAVKNENFKYRLTISRNDEIGQLAENFNLMQQQLAHNDEARKAFISDVSHDFQSPLMNIQGYSELLQNEETLGQEYQQYAGIIQRESKRLSNLTKQLLLLTSIDQASYTLKRNEVQVDAQLKEVIRIHQWRVTEGDLALSYKLNPIQIIGDAELLYNCWENLIGNAIKYAKPGGLISISSTLVDNFVEITISDTGIGIDSEHLEKIFDRFYRVDAARKKDGTGLGLSIVKKVVQLHNGTIKVNSKIDKGSSFTIRLPLNREMK